MYSFISVRNESSQVLSLFCDDELFIQELLPEDFSKPIRIMCGSVHTVIKNGRDKVIFDLWLPVKKETSHTLILRDTSFNFI